jgi:hypothetical protein
MRTIIIDRKKLNIAKQKMTNDLNIKDQIFSTYTDIYRCTVQLKLYRDFNLSIKISDSRGTLYYGFIKDNIDNYKTDDIIELYNLLSKTDLEPAKLLFI